MKYPSCPSEGNCSPSQPKKVKKLRSSGIVEEIENKENVIIETTTQSRQRRPSKKLLSASAPATLTSNNLLGNFEESVLNGRLEPNSTVEGFTAEIGASGAFQPKHRTLPVTVFFYTLCDNAAYSSPYLGMIRFTYLSILGKHNIHLRTSCYSANTAVSKYQNNVLLQRRNIAALLKGYFFFTNEMILF